MYTHIEILPVLVSDGSSKFVSLKYFKYEIRIALSFSFVVVHTSFFCIPCSSTKGDIFSVMISKSTYMYDRVNEYTAKIFYGSWMSKLSPRDCVDLPLFAREICCLIVSNISRTHGGW